MKHKYKIKKYKIFLPAMAVIIYIGILVYISSIQSDFDVKISTETDVFEFKADMDSYTIPVNIENNANRLLSSAEDQNIFLSYHLYDDSGELISFDNIRSSFERNIYSKEKGIVQLKVLPLKAGDYILEIDLLQEYVTWFSEQGNELKKIKLIVK